LFNVRRSVSAKGFAGVQDDGAVTFRRPPAQWFDMKQPAPDLIHLILLALLAIAPAGAWAGSSGPSLARAVVDIREVAATGTVLHPGRVLVELFTSQGCSSCPAADRLVSRLGSDDAEVLAFHVDYWNHIGWTDPFSSRRWSERQSAYAAVWKENRIYTPQAVVDGQLEGVGSDERWLRGALRRRLDAERARFAIQPLDEAGREFAVEVDLAGSGGGAAELWLAVTESGFKTPVGSGENAHATLANDHVVLALTRLGELSVGRKRFVARLEGSPATGHVQRLVAFVVEPRRRAVLGAASR